MQVLLLRSSYLKQAAIRQMLYLTNGQRGDSTHCPRILEVETDSILRQKVSLRRELTVAEAQRAFASLLGLPIKTTHSPEQRERAWEIAREFQFPTVYDATYLALAELHQCEFWTADDKLFKQVRDQLPFVQWLGNYPVS